MKDEDKDEKDYEVIDKRVSTDESVEPEQPAEESVKTDETEQPEAGEEPEGDVYSLIQWIIIMLTESAWQWLGLHMNPVSKKTKTDLEQAKMAIDSLVFLVDKISPKVSEEQRREYRRIVSDLQLNFVQRSRAD